MEDTGVNEGDRDGGSYLHGVRVLELADETGEYAGRVLAGLGADVVKVEPPDGEATRRIGPFRGDVPAPEESLHFWHYNLGKRSIVLELDAPDGQESFRRLASAADVVLDARPRGWLAERNLGFERLRAANPRLIHLRISPFGDDGPWADFKGSDLVHLALGGVMMNCGYDPDPAGHYDTPPIAPQMWQAYHIAGEMSVIALLGALAHRLRSGEGQALSLAIHEAVSMNTESDLPNWIFLRQRHRRQTCRHSMPSASLPALAETRDGRHLLPYRTYLRATATYSADALRATIAVLAKHGMDEGLARLETLDADTEARVGRLVDRLAGSLDFAADLWRDGQDHGLPWAPVRRPEENAGDRHYIQRGIFAEVPHPETGAAYTYVAARWYSPDAPWAVARQRPPRLGEHTRSVLAEWRAPRPLPSLSPDCGLARGPATAGPTGKPFALSGVRVVDLGWMLASAGAGRFLAALGAEVIKVEHESRADGMRFGPAACPLGGRAERERARDGMPTPPREGLNRSGSFMEINAGKLALSLDLKKPEGKRILEDLIRNADVVLEGYSPGTMDRMGLGYDRLRALNPGIVYLQQSGFGQHGLYGRARAFGPTAQAFSGISDMSGLPEPRPPAGIGYSYLDWFGAYNLATAALAALYRRAITGRGCHVDASQAEVGIFLTGTAILDHSVNGRRWTRTGNRSPWRPAAPHGAYPTRPEAGGDEDRWIAIAAFSDAEWRALAGVLGHAEWLDDPRFDGLANRRANQDALDALVARATAKFDGADLMRRLQAAGMAAGVCQTAEDRYERDPQLRHLGWLVELPQTELGTWPVKGFPARLERSPAWAGGPPGRSGPNYGEDTERVLASVLGMTEGQVAALRAAGVV
jgi:crotonobetainyl-CoA:carnitine CoA-transferase CaiB-like acyl-CoA transferase